MKFVYDDGGRKAAGYKGHTGDCTVRAIAIATGHLYTDIYDIVNLMAKEERITKRRPKRGSARTGIRMVTIRKIMEGLGWTWVPTMGIGTGTTVHLRDGELPMGRLIVRCSKHMVAVIDGVIHDTGDPGRDGTRAVYGYWYKPKTETSR